MGAHGAAGAGASDLDIIQTVVVIYAENRSFDNLYGTFPGRMGSRTPGRMRHVQRDRDGIGPGRPARGLGRHQCRVTAGAPLAPVTGDGGAVGRIPQQFQPSVCPVETCTARPFGLDAIRCSYTNRDLYHRFYENQMQINGGKNDMFAAWADAGGLTMGYFTPPPTESALELARSIHARRQLLPGRVRRLVPEPPVPDLLLRADLSGHDGINPQPAAQMPVPAALNADGVTLTRPPPRRPRRWTARRPSSTAPRHACPPRLLRRQHHAAALSAQRQRPTRSADPVRPDRATHRCRRRRRPRSATC